MDLEINYIRKGRKSEVSFELPSDFRVEEVSMLPNPAVYVTLNQFFPSLKKSQQVLGEGYFSINFDGIRAYGNHYIGRKKVSVTKKNLKIPLAFDISVNGVEKKPALNNYLDLKMQDFIQEWENKLIDHVDGRKELSWEDSEKFNLAFETYHSIKHFKELVEAPNNVKEFDPKVESVFNEILLRKTDAYVFISYSNDLSVSKKFSYLGLENELNSFKSSLADLLGNEAHII